VASAKRVDGAHLIADLEQHGNRYGFFQAVQLLHRLAPESVPIGELGPATAEPVRLKHDPALSFAASDVKAIRFIERPGAEPQAELTSTFLGLSGASSPLSVVMAEEVIRDLQDQEGSLAAFYDILHHRLLSLFYRTWKKYRFFASFRNDGSDPLTRRSLAFVGVDMAGALPRFALPPIVQLSLAQLLAQRARSARTLEVALSYLLPEHIEIAVESFVERVIDIQVDQRVKVGIANTTLAEDFTIGRRILDRSGRFRVHLGPVDYDTYQSILPGQPLYATLRDIIHQFTRGILEAEVEVRLKAEDSPRFALGDRRGAILGQTTRLNAREIAAMRARIVLKEEDEHVTPEILA
jgi:type VI secretion system protein ImpH